MRSGTRKVADSKPDAPARKESDTIPMTDIGKKNFFWHKFSLLSFPELQLPFLMSYVCKFLFIFCFSFSLTLSPSSPYFRYALSIFLKKVMKKLLQKKKKLMMRHQMLVFVSKWQLLRIA